MPLCGSLAFCAGLLRAVPVGSAHLRRVARCALRARCRSHAGCRRARRFAVRCEKLGSAQFEGQPIGGIGAAAAAGLSGDSFSIGIGNRGMRWDEVVAELRRRIIGYAQQVS